MSTPSDTRIDGAAPAADPKDPDAIRADIERTRESLAETVDALHEKLDVKAKARAKLAQVKECATTDAGKPRPAVVVGAVGALAAVTGLVWWRRR